MRTHPLTVLMMAAAAVLASVSLFSCRYVERAGEPQWSKTYGYTKADTALAVDQSGDGGYFLAGYTKSKGAGNNDVWVLKLDSAGTVVWEKTFGESESEFAYAISRTPDMGCIVAGEKRIYNVLDDYNLTPSYKWDMYVIKLEASGATLWEKCYGGADYDRANAVIPATDGGYIVAGHTQSYADGYTPPPHNKKDIWIIKLDGSGEKTWEVVHGGKEADGINAIDRTPDGGYIAAGFTASYGQGGYDCEVLRLGPGGDILWEKAYGGTLPDAANCVRTTADGGCIVAGETWSYGAGKTDFWVLKLSQDGSVQWSRTVGGAGFERAQSVSQTVDGGYLVAGYTSSSGAGNKDVWTVKLDAQGTLLWSQTYGGASCDMAYSLKISDDQSYIVAGNTSSSGSGDIDAWVLKFARPGKVLVN
ncbi:MAG TPA: hypothetical protein PLB81_00445 [Deltaproteobacteria bacterium]|nr:hypothetical protein [Deltaproteobacteria bacterium]